MSLRQCCTGGQLLGPARHGFARARAKNADPVLVDDDRATQDFAGARVFLTRPYCGGARALLCKPAHGKHAHAFGSRPVGIGRLLLDGQCVEETCFLESLVPLLDGFAQGLAPDFWDVAVHHHADGLFGLGQRRCRVLLLQTPAVDEVCALAFLGVVAEVGERGIEVADARIGHTRLHRLRRQRSQCVGIGQEQAARIRHAGGRAWLSAWVGRGSTWRRCGRRR